MRKILTASNSKLDVYLILFISRWHTEPLYCFKKYWELRFKWNIYISISAFKQKCDCLFGKCPFLSYLRCQCQQELFSAVVYKTCTVLSTADMLDHCWWENLSPVILGGCCSLLWKGQLINQWRCHFLHNIVSLLLAHLISQTISLQFVAFILIMSTAHYSDDLLLIDYTDRRATEYLSELSLITTDHHLTYDWDKVFDIYRIS